LLTARPRLRMQKYGLMNDKSKRTNLAAFREPRKLLVVNVDSGAIISCRPHSPPTTDLSSDAPFPSEATPLTSRIRTYRRRLISGASMVGQIVVVNHI